MTEQELEDLDSAFRNSERFDEFFISNYNFVPSLKSDFLMLDMGTIRDNTANKILNDPVYALKFLRWVAEFIVKNKFNLRETNLQYCGLQGGLQGISLNHFIFETFFNFSDVK